MAAAALQQDRDYAAAMLVATRIRHPGRIALRGQTALDHAFVEDLAMACSPLAGLLPMAMVRQQAVFQRIGYDDTYPSAMRTIVTRDEHPVGRLLIDWSPGLSRCVDIAILPALHGHGIGTALLSCWLAVANQLGLSATLSVRRDNRAIALYRRLGLTETGDPTDPVSTMRRVA